VADAAARFVVGDTTRRTFTPGISVLTRAPEEKRKHFVIYASDADAETAGFAPRQALKRARAG
jgi:hypothetical protein